MAIVLKNLVARTPQTCDLQTISRLIGLCESIGEKRENSLAQPSPLWPCPDFHLATDAWIIATNRGQMVGFACIWCSEPEQILTFLCVDPAYRNRGIGTLLLRLVEMRARQQVRLARPGVRVILRGLVDPTNVGAQNLFVREGYQAGEQVLRVSFRHAQESSELPVPAVTTKLSADIGSTQRWLKTIPHQDDLCTICLYSVYEKELRPTSVPSAETQRGPIEASTYAIARAS